MQDFMGRHELPVPIIGPNRTSVVEPRAARCPMGLKQHPDAGIGEHRIPHMSIASATVLRPTMWFKEIQCRLPHNQSQSVDDLVPVDLVGSAHGGRALRARLEEAAEDLVQRRQRRRAHHGGRGALHRGRLSFGRHRAATRVSRRARLQNRRVFIVPFACCCCSTQRARAHSLAA